MIIVDTTVWVDYLNNVIHRSDDMCGSGVFGACDSSEIEGRITGIRRG